MLSGVVSWILVLFLEQSSEISDHLWQLFFWCLKMGSITPGDGNFHWFKPANFLWYLF